MEEGRFEILENVREYYGRMLKGSKDLKTSACCPTGSIPGKHRRILADIDGEILDKFYGCGSPIPEALDGCTVLDLGCGTGRDVYLLSRLVGQEGLVIGIDMTDEQLYVARRHIGSQMKRFGYGRPNVDFRKGFIEDLAACGIADGSIDVVISNCVINLSPEKDRVFSEIMRVLKPGGELYFSDVFSGRRVPEKLRKDPVLYGECLGGAMYTEDFRRLLGRLGCPDIRTVSRTPITIDNPEMAEKAGMIDFFSMTVRVFKLDGMEDICEDYGQTATYLGTIPDSPHSFILDDHHEFITGKPLLVCGNTASMVGESRLARHFRVTGDRSTHFGPFPCGPAVTSRTETDKARVGCC